MGNLLRQIREAEELTTADMAEKLGWSASKVSRLERGAATASPAELVRYAAKSGAELGDIDHLLGWCQEVVLPGYWLSRHFASLIFHESTAAFSSTYVGLVVPGLLQTEEYAAALIARERLEPSTAKFRVGVRMMRQERLHDQPNEFFIHEQALRLPVGGNRVMNEQMLKLLLFSNQPGITIRVVPTKLGERAMFGGGFSHYRFTGGGPLVCQDVVPTCLFIEDRDYVTRYHGLLVDMAEVALGREESREIIANVASEFDRPEKDPDCVAVAQLQR